MLKDNNFSKTLLKKRNLKATPTRIQLIELVRIYQSAMPYTMIQQSLSDTDRITLYRTLNVLLEKGILHKAYVSQEDTFYALCDDNCSTVKHIHNHIHFKCNACHLVTCEQLPEKIKITLPAYQIDKIRVNVTGLCQNCNSSQQAQ